MPTNPQYLRLAGWDGVSPITPDLLRRAQEMETGRRLPPITAPVRPMVELPQAPSLGDLLRPAPRDAPNIYNMQQRINREIDQALLRALGVTNPGALNESIRQGLSRADEAVRNVLGRAPEVPRNLLSPESIAGREQRARQLLERIGLATPPVAEASQPAPPEPEQSAPVPQPELVPQMTLPPQPAATAMPMPDIPAPNWEAVREMFRQAAPKQPDTDPREKWIIGLIGAMLGAQQNPGERLGAMFARMAGAGAQAGINVRREDREREDAFRREQQQHAMNLAGLEAKIAEAEWKRLFDQWRTAEQLGIERGKLDIMRENSGLRTALLAASLGSNISPEMLLSGVVDRAASGQLLIPGLPPDKLREEAMKLLEQRDRNAFLMLRSGASSNPALRDVYNTAVRQVIVNHLAALPDEQRARVLNAYRGVFESRPRAGRIPELLVE